eukprot:1397050-Prymnesium_polylepis.1
MLRGPGRQSQAASNGFERDAICKTEESEAGQRAPIRPRGGGRHKGACEGVGKGIGMVFSCGCPCSPDPWATPRRSAAAPATKT